MKGGQAPSCWTVCDILKVCCSVKHKEKAISCRSSVIKTEYIWDSVAMFLAVLVWCYFLVTLQRALLNRTKKKILWTECSSMLTQAVFFSNQRHSFDFFLSVCSFKQSSMELWFLSVHPK